MTQNGQAEVGDQVFFFASVLDDPGHAGQVLAAQVVKRPTTANILYLLILDQDATPFQNSNIAQASSLEQCLEIGHCWASKEQLIRQLSRTWDKAKKCFPVRAFPSFFYVR